MTGLCGESFNSTRLPVYSTLLHVSRCLYSSFRPSGCPGLGWGFGRLLLPLADRRGLEAPETSSAIPQLVFEAVSCLFLLAWPLLVRIAISSLPLSYALKLRWDQNGYDHAKAWKISPSTHIVRRVAYKGRSAAVSGNRLRLAFDGLTTPGLLYAVGDSDMQITCITQNGLCSHIEVGNGLQVKGCKPALQLSSMETLQTVLGCSLKSDFDLDLMPDTAECFLSGLYVGIHTVLRLEWSCTTGLLRIRNSQMDLRSLRDFLDYAGLTQRPGIHGMTTCNPMSCRPGGLNARC